MRRLPAMAALLIAAAVVALLALAQLVLPGVAERRLRSDLEPFGDVRAVDVHAFPAVKLLWKRADRVTVSLGSYRPPSSDLADALAQTDETDRLDARVAVLRSGLLTLRDARLVKRGDDLIGTATLDDSDLRSALPFAVALRRVEAPGPGLVLEGEAGAFGVRARARVRVRTREGEVVVAPDVPLGGLATITVFADPRLAVSGIDARPRNGGVELTARGRLR